MSIQQTSEHAAFNAFVSEQLGNDLGGKSLEDAVSDFRAYQLELKELRAKVAVAVEQSARGESEELDDEAFWVDVDALLKGEGLPD